MLAHLAVGAEGLDGVRKARLKFGVTSSPYERGSVATARQPTLLLPTGKSRRPKSHLLDYRRRNPLRVVVTADARRIRELGVELDVSRTIGDAPRADALRQLLSAIDRAGVDETTPLATTLALGVRTLDAPGRNRVGVVFEGWQIHGTYCGLTTQYMSSEVIHGWRGSVAAVRCPC